MRNDWLEVRSCRRFVAVIRCGPIGRLVLADLPRFQVSGFALIGLPPRTLVLEGIPVEDADEAVLASLPEVIRRGSLHVDEDGGE